MKPHLIAKPKIYFLDFFKERQKTKLYITEMLSTPPFQAFCNSIGDLTLIFSDVISDEIVILLSNLELPEERLEELKSYFRNDFLLKSLS